MAPYRRPPLPPSTPHPSPTPTHHPTPTPTPPSAPAGYCAWLPPCRPATWRAMPSQWWPSPLSAGWARTRSAWVSARSPRSGGKAAPASNVRAEARRAWCRQCEFTFPLSLSSVPRKTQTDWRRLRAAFWCAAVVLATSVFNVTGLAVLIGFASAMEVRASLGVPFLTCKPPCLQPSVAAMPLHLGSRGSRVLHK